METLALIVLGNIAVDAISLSVIIVRHLTIVAVAKLCVASALERMSATIISFWDVSRRDQRGSCSILTLFIMLLVCFIRYHSS